MARLPRLRAVAQPAIAPTRRILDMRFMEIPFVVRGFTADDAERVNQAVSDGIERRAHRMHVVSYSTFSQAVPMLPTPYSWAVMQNWPTMAAAVNV